jgi:hypothetical protein
MTDGTRTRLCLSDSCGQPHECRHPISQCRCPFCDGDAVETVGAERLPGFGDVAAKPAERRYPG